MLSAGLYRFTGGRDDGMRVYVDNEPIVDWWTFGNADYSVDKVVTGGPHELRVEYFEGGGGARAEFTYERIGDVVPADGGYSAEYFANRNLQGAPVLTRTGRRRRLQLGRRHAWRRRARGQLLRPVDQVVDVEEAGTYKFTVTSDDGFRLYRGRAAGARQVGPPGADDVHRDPPAERGRARDRARVLRGERGRGRQAQLRADRRTASAAPPEPFAAEYFDNSTLAGDPGAHAVRDDAIDFDWGEGAPAPACPATGSRRAGRGRRPTPPAPIGSA